LRLGDATRDYGIGPEIKVGEKRVENLQERIRLVAFDDPSSRSKKKGTMGEEPV